MKYLALVALVSVPHTAWSVLLSSEGWGAKQQPVYECRPDYSRLDHVSNCVQQGGQTCPMSAMKANESTMVFPGGKTRCMDNTKPEYAFQVVPGSSDKLLINFEGGGATWDYLSYSVKACVVANTYPYPRIGFLDGLPRNPFLGYTVLNIAYCSCDLHSGNAVHEWRDQNGQKVKQFGYHNTRSAIDWAKANFKGKLSSLILMGQSAGGIGTQVWAPTLLTEFDYESASVISDSYLGIFPPGFQGPVFKDLRVCELDIIPPELKDLCTSGRITIPDVFEHAMKMFPRVAFASINAKGDFVQPDFYRKAAISKGNVLEYNQYQQERFLQSMYKVLQQYHAHPNFVSLTVPAKFHSFSACNSLYTEKAMLNGRSYAVADWLAQFTADPPMKKLQGICMSGPGEQRPLGCDPTWANREFVIPQ